ncbi:hypothetical protein NHX12_022334, partial [Muraenolepis orangiensis]
HRVGRSLAALAESSESWTGSTARWKADASPSQGSSTPTISTTSTTNPTTTTISTTPTITSTTTTPPRSITWHPPMSAVTNEQRAPAGVARERHQPGGILGTKKRVFKISDIVNRIAPTDARPAESSLLQWIGDSPVMCVPEATPSRPRRRSARQSSVDGLIELARQFDKNMEQSNALAASPSLHGDGPSSSSPEASRPGVSSTANPRRSESQRAEAELRELFDRSTQGFEDDWENDDLLALGMTQEAEPPSRPLPRTPPSGGHTAKSVTTAKPVAVMETVTTGTKVKPVAVMETVTTGTKVKPVAVMETVNTGTKVKPVAVMETVTTGTKVKPVAVMETVTMAKPQPRQTHTVAVQSASGADCSWDEGGDDQLLFQVCADAERLSNSQPTPLATPIDRGRDATAPVAIAGARPGSVACGYGRSHSVPGAIGDSLGYRGWNVQMKGAGGGVNQSALSQSHPGGPVGPGALSHLRDTSGTFQNTGAGFQPQTVIARPPGNYRSHHATFKRHPSDSAILSSRASPGARCSAADIERKRQEALARKRQRMHDSQKQ